MLRGIKGAILQNPNNPQRDHIQRTSRLFEHTNQHITKLKKQCSDGKRGRIDRETYWKLNAVGAIVLLNQSGFTHKRWIKYNLRYVKESLPRNWYRSYEKHGSDTSVVYLVCSHDDKHQYIGESGSWKTRFFSEITAAKQLTRMRQFNTHIKYQAARKGKLSQAPRFIRFLAAKDTENWVTLPIKTLTTRHNTDTHTRKQWERHLIRALNPSLNTAHVIKRWRKDDHIKKPRNRAPIAIRKKKRL